MRQVDGAVEAADGTLATELAKSNDARAIPGELQDPPDCSRFAKNPFDRPLGVAPMRWLLGRRDRGRSWTGS